MGEIGAEEARADTLVWIDSREAVILRWRRGRARVERVRSAVPAHHKATGHVRHDPTVRHGGGGSPQTAGEPHRLEHLEQFMADVTSRLALNDDLLIIGAGTVHERLGRHLLEHDRRRGASRGIDCETSPRLTDHQLIARLRRFAGVEPRRRSVGPYRQCRASVHRPARPRAGAPADGRPRGVAQP